MQSTIEARQVMKRYGEVEAVCGVDLAIAPGELFGLIGHNGAGKSTMFKMMLGLVPVTAGEIRINGHPVRGEQFRRVRRHLGYLPENVVFYDNLTGLETLKFFAGIKRVEHEECVKVLERVGLAHASDRRVRGYSKGMRQRLGFAQALLGNPNLLFLDEPTTGLDPEGIKEFYGILTDLQGRGVTIILTSHILSEIQERVDRLAIMKSGRIQAIGTVQSLREKMILPLWFELHLVEGCEAELHSVIAPISGAAISINAGQAVVHCKREVKMAVYQALASLNGRITDIQMREPSLEDIFLGYSA